MSVNLLPARFRRAPRREEPSVIDDLAALPEETNPYAASVPPLQAIGDALDEAGGLFPPHPLPRAVFRPAPPRETLPMQALPVNAAVPPPAGAQDGVKLRRAETIRARAVDMPDVALLRRVRDGLEAKWTVEAFTADKKALPCFDATTRTVGWLGLHMPRQPIARHERWTTDLWFASAMTSAARAEEAARVEARAEFDAVQQRCDDRFRLIASGGAR